ncbi:MAG TPA: hypothetical protein VF735_03065 [Pyrinomonadaceae bacterium]|jgi:hypothetical protein
MSCTAAARLVLAAMLAFALLAGIVPVGALSSDHQTCQMSCCAGKPAHDAGSCSTAFADEPQAESPAEPINEAHAHKGGTHGASAEIVEAAQGCGTTAQPSTDEAGSSSRDQSSPARSITAHALTTPCSPECAAASLSAFGQVRRPRNTSALATRHSPRPTTHAAPAEQVAKLQVLSVVTGRQSGPRAPPLRPENLPA